MGKELGKVRKILHWILGTILILVFVIFIFAEAFGPKEIAQTLEECDLFEACWERVLPDGSREPIDIPGECEAQKGEVVCVETVLPQEQQHTFLCIRSMQQEIRVYVGDELRQEYSTLETQPFGKTSTMAYVFIELQEYDAGKTLRLELSSYSAYAGYISEIYVGERDEIMQYFIRLYAPTAIVAGFMLLLSFVVISYSLFSKLINKKDVEISYLGSEIMIASTWLLVESRLRQFIMPNYTYAMYMGFYMIMLLPYPFVAYLNRIQKNRYQKAFMFLQIAAIINVVITTILQVLNIKDLFETMTVSHIILVGLILLCGITIILDMRKGTIKEYTQVAWGLAALMFAGIVEIYFVYQKSSHYNGIPLCFGLVALLYTAVMKMSHDVKRIESEKQRAIAENESRGKFLASMSHEIRTPINTVIGMNEMILRENQDENINEYANNIKNASRMLLSLINDILDLSKMEAGKLLIVEDEYNLVNLLKDVIRENQMRTAQKELQFHVSVDETLPMVLKGDVVRIKQILNNLLSNAAKYTEKGSVTLEIKGHREGDKFFLELAVTDTGIGIRKEDLDKVFDSFLRFELNTNRYKEGTGLGLSITKQLVDNMQGTITVESEYHVGSSFVVRIPQEVLNDTPVGDVVQRISEKEIIKRETYRALNFEKFSVLIVDDNEMNLKVMEGLLKRTMVKMDFVTGGYDCLIKTKEKVYDLILMDHMMPGLDGVATLHKIREDADNRNRETKVIVLTANAIAGAKEQYREEGFTDYLSKPIEAELLEDMLLKYLDPEKAEEVKVRKEVEMQKESVHGHKDEDVASEGDSKAKDANSPDESVTTIDRETGLKYCGRKEELYRKALAIYAKQGDGFINQLQKYYEEKNWDDYAILVHSIKSTSQGIGALRMFEIAKEQEAAAKAKDEVFLNREYEPFLAAYKTLLEHIRANEIS